MRSITRNRPDGGFRQGDAYSVMLSRKRGLCRYFLLGA